IDRNDRIGELAVGAQMTDTQLGELAGAATDWILMTLHARSRVEDRTESGRHIVSRLIDLLIQSVRVSCRLGEPVAATPQPRSPNQCGRFKASRRIDSLCRSCAHCNRVLADCGKGLHAQ